MKITKSEIKKLIKEELESIKEDLSGMSDEALKKKYHSLGAQIPLRPEDDPYGSYFSLEAERDEIKKELEKRGKPLEESKVKITKEQLKQLIKEELQSIMEARGRYVSSGYSGRTDKDPGDPRYIRQRDYSEPTGRSKPSSRKQRDLANFRNLNRLEQALRLKLPLINYAKLPQYGFEGNEDLYELAKELDRFYNAAKFFEENPEDYPELRDRFNARLKKFEDENEENLKLFAKRIGYGFGKFAPEEYLLPETDEG